MNKISLIELVLGFGVVGGAVFAISMWIGMSRDTSYLAALVVGAFFALWLVIHRAVSLLRVAFASNNRIADRLRQITQ